MRQAVGSSCGRDYRRRRGHRRRRSVHEASDRLRGEKQESKGDKAYAELTVSIAQLLPRLRQDVLQLLRIDVSESLCVVVLECGKYLVGDIFRRAMFKHDLEEVIELNNTRV